MMALRAGTPAVRCRVERPRNCCRVKVSAIGPAGRAETHVHPYRLTQGYLLVMAIAGGAA